jgi:hypothetical protein
MLLGLETLDFSIEDTYAVYVALLGVAAEQLLAYADS